MQLGHADSSGLVPPPIQKSIRSQPRREKTQPAHYRKTSRIDHPRSQLRHRSKQGQHQRHAKQGHKQTAEQPSGDLVVHNQIMRKLVRAIKVRPSSKTRMHMNRKCEEGRERQQTRQRGESKPPPGSKGLCSNPERPRHCGKGRSNRPHHQRARRE